MKLNVMTVSRSQPIEVKNKGPALVRAFEKRNGFCYS